MTTTRDYKALSRGVSRDMSPAAITRRLRIVNELFQVSISLGRARFVCKSAAPARDISRDR